MSIFFKADELLAMAQRIERNGARFYSKASELSPNSNVSTLLQALASMEEEHEKIFSDMKEEISKQKGKASGSEFDDEATSYLHAWADGHVFDIRTDPSESLTGNESLEDIFNKAIELEKDSIVFYLGFKDAVQGKHEKEVIERILKEEMRHIATLSAQLASLRHKLV